MVKCNNCKNLETKDNGFDAYSWCEKINDCPHEDIERDCEHYAPMINADRIRSMTDEELTMALLCVLRNLLKSDKVFKIVKGKYVTEQSCEWKLEDSESNLYVTECENRQLIFEGTPEENGYKYCPYCSRKIKRGGTDDN